MHSITEFEGNIPAFLAKLWNMVEEPSLDDLIAWGANGLSFVIKDQNRFAKELLPMYYKHNNMASFIRQLNMYGFHKNLSLESGCAKMEEVIIEFYHPCFQKNNPNLLQNIKRKINSGRGGGGSVASAGGGNQPGAAVVNQVLHDVRKMKSRQNEVDSRLAQMKMENEALWREVAMLRQKHIKQQQIVNKLIQFLVSFVQHPHGNGISVKRRNIPLMLQDRSTHSNTLNKNSQSLSGISEITRSPTGPVIHEIDPNEYAASLLLNDVRGVDASSPQDPTASQETGIDNDETGGASDPADDNSEIVATDELLDLPDQLLADAALPATSADRLTTADGSQLFARPNQIRASKRRPRKPAATKKLSQLDAGNFKVADESCPTDQQSDVITGLVLDDFPLIIPGSQALEQLSSLPTTADDVTALSPQTVSIEAVTSPIAANLTADSPIAANLTANSPGVANLTADSPGVVNLTADSPSIANLTADSPIPIITATSPYSADLTAFAEVLPIDPATIVSSTIDNSPVTIVNSTPTIVNSTVPIVAPQKKGRYKKIVPKLSIPEPKSRTVEKSQVKVIRPQRKRRSSAQSSSSSSSSRSGGDKRSKAAQKDGGAQAPPPPPSAAPENSDRTVACMSPSNSQQSIKQEIDNHVDSMQNDLETLKELLKGESISLDANTLLGLFNAEDPFSLTMDLPTTMPTEDKSKEPDNNQLVSYSWGGGAPVPPLSSQQQDLGDLFGGDYQDWLLGGGGSGEGEGVGGVATSLAEDDDDDLYGMADLNTPDVLVTPDSTPTLTPGVAAKKKRK